MSGATPEAGRTNSDQAPSVPARALPQSYRGQRIGLPDSGPRSLASLGPRFGAFIVDAVASALVAALFVRVFSPDHSRLPGSWSLIPLAINYVLGILFAGRTLGMNLFGLRLIRIDREAAIGPVRAVVRTALLVLFIPALVMDRDNRGLHDRLTDTAVVRN